MYVKRKPKFNVQYTDIPKILRGYYKEVNGEKTENLERSKSENIRSGNVWVDVQQVFYRMKENVGGCYEQKPLKCIERLILASSAKNDVVADFFALRLHSHCVGETKELVPELKKPSRKDTPSYAGEYDFYLDGKFKVEVKASRTVDSSTEGSLVERVLSSRMRKPFLMHFQQVKLSCCDVFVWVAVWCYKIRYWVLSSKSKEKLIFYR